MIFKRFALNLLVKVVLLTLNLLVAVWLTLQEGFPITQFVVWVFALIQVYLLYRFVQKSNDELSRFLLSARYEEHNANFDFTGRGAAFEELGDAFTDILHRLQKKRTNQEETSNWLKSVIEHVPVPLLSIHSDNRITLWNNSARRLFGSKKIVRLEELKYFGDEFYKALQSATSTERKLVKFVADGIEQKLSISVREIIHGGDRERVVSLQDIASELDKAQLNAWQDLVRVLTHEIINSITPIASLSSTAADLMKSSANTANPDLEDLKDAEAAVATVAKRSHGLMEFINSYRQITHLPPPQKQPVKLNGLLERIQTLFANDWAKQGVQFSLVTELKDIEIEADPQMLEQLFINLFKNAQQAKSQDQSILSMTTTIELNKRGKVMLTVSDDGMGIPADIRGNIFVPFFTTKRDGSGVGLALARQIMLVHGGSIRLEDSEGSGATFTLVFP